MGRRRRPDVSLLSPIDLPRVAIQTPDSQSTHPTVNPDIRSSNPDIRSSNPDIGSSNPDTQSSNPDTRTQDPGPGSGEHWGLGTPRPLFFSKIQEIPLTGPWEGLSGPRHILEK